MEPYRANGYMISRKFKFECAHKLNNLVDGHPCSCIHGHSYKIEMVLFAKDLNSQGFIIDFGELKPFQKWLDDNFDHALIVTEKDYKEELNILLQKHKYFIMRGYNNTSAENMAHLFVNTFYELFKEDLDFKNNVYQIFCKVWETENNYASYWMYI